MARQYQGSLSGGEVDPGVWGQIGLERMGSMLRIARNVIIQPEGGAMKRPGLEFISFAHGPVANINNTVRPLPFKFNNEQTYEVMAMSDRVFFAKNGGVIFEPRVGSGTITVGQDANGTFINASGGGLTYAAGAILYFASGGYLQLENRWVRVASAPAPTANRVYLNDYITNLTVGISGFTAQGGTIDYGLIYFLDTADGWYASVDPMELDYTQSNDKLFVSHDSAKTKVLTRTGDTAWTITDFNPAPSNVAPTVSLSAGSNEPPGTNTVQYAVTSVETANGTFEESLADLFDVTSVDRDAINATDFVELEWAHVAGNDKYYVYKATSGLYGLIGRAEGTSGTLTFRDEGFVPNLAIAPPIEADIFDAANEYPSAVELAQQRIWFGRTKALLRDVYGSRAGSLNSFATSTVTADDDPIELAIAAKSVQEVRHFVPLKDLIVLTSDGEWGFDTGDDGLVSTRSGLIAHSFWGSAKVKPAIVGESAIFVERTGRSIRDLAYALQSDGFASSNLSLFAKHLFRYRQVKSICFAQTPFNVLFVVFNDGLGAFCTYVRDQQIFGWSRVDTNGRMHSCMSIEEGGRDNIYVEVERVYNGTTPYRQIERMTMIDPEFSDQGIWLDNSIEFNRPNQYLADPFDGTFTKAETLVESGVLTLRLTGSGTALVNNELFQLQAPAGSPLAIFDGMTFMAEVVSPNLYRLYRTVNGSTTKKQLFNVENYLPSGFIATGTVGYWNDGIGLGVRAHHLNYRAGLVTVRADLTEYKNVTLAAGGIYTFTTDPLAFAGKIHLGEPFVCEIETLDVDAPANPITGLPVQLSTVGLRFSLANAVKIGRYRESLLTIPLSVFESMEDFSINRGAFRGVMTNLQYPAWRPDGRVVVRSEDGFPFVLTALIPTVDIGTIDGE